MSFYRIEAGNVAKGGNFNSYRRKRTKRRTCFSLWLNRVFFCIVDSGLCGVYWDYSGSYDAVVYSTNGASEIFPTVEEVTFAYDTAMYIVEAELWYLTWR